MAGIGEIITESQIWKSIFRHPMPVDRRNRIVVMVQWAWAYVTYQRSIRLITGDTPAESG